VLRTSVFALGAARRAHARVPAAPRFASARQRSEQYFTSAQFFAHARRHVIGRAH
jgi:hypothetical protein